MTKRGMSCGATGRGERVGGGGRRRRESWPPTSGGLGGYRTMRESRPARRWRPGGDGEEEREPTADEGDAG
jgi:hypothetical protein